MVPPLGINVSAYVYTHSLLFHHPINIDLFLDFEDDFIAHHPLW